MSTNRFALLVATYDYQDQALSQLIAPAHDAEELAEVLRDPKIAGFEVTILLNEPHWVVGQAIADFFRERRHDDLALLYFTGHGLKDDDGRLYLAMTNTKRDSVLFSGLSAEQIDYAMDTCSSRQTVLILDCCYSGAFPAGRFAKSDRAIHSLERFRGRGRAVLTASDSAQYSFEGDDVQGTGVRSLFTRFLVEGIKTGRADLDSDGDISLEELYSYVHDRVVEQMPQQRPKKQENVEGRIVIAKNIHWSIPEYLKNAIASPLARERRGAVDVLAHLYHSGNELVREGVIRKAMDLVNDDSKAVSTATELAFADFFSDHPPQSSEKHEREDHKALKTETNAAELTIKAPVGGGDEPDADITVDCDRPDTKAYVDRGSPKLQEQHSIGDGSLGAGDQTSGERDAALPRNNPTPAPSIVAVAQPSPISSPRPELEAGDKSRGQDAGRRHSSWLKSRRPVVLVVAAVLALTASVSLLTIGVQRTSSSNTPTAQPVAAPSPAATTTPTPVPVAASFAVPIVTATAPVEAQPLAVTVAPGGEHAYVTNEGAGVVSVLDVKTGSVVKTIPIPAGPPQFIAFSPDGRIAYVSVWSRDSRVNAVVVVDLASDSTIATIPVGTRPFALAVSPDGSEIYVACHDSGSVYVLDAAMNAVAAEIRVAPNPHVVTFSADGRLAYVANHESNLVSILDVPSRQVNVMIPVGKSPHSLALSPDDREVYVVNYDANSVSVIDTSTNAVRATIAVQTNPQGVAYSPDGRYGYVVNDGSNSLSVINTQTGEVSATIPLGAGPTSIAVTPDGRRAFVTNHDANTVTALEVGR